MKLRAVADLLLASEPHCLFETEYPGGKRGLTVIFTADSYHAADREVRRRVLAGDEDYTITVEYRRP
jgi:hypothetical protein